MTAKLTRRALLGSALGAAASAALAEAPSTSMRPMPRPAPRDPGAAPPITRPSLAELVAEHRLENTVGIAAANDATGEFIDSHSDSRHMPCASVTKALTTVYALDALGPDHRFTTRVLATGPVENGIVQGDLVLAGGGDPTLDTSDLAGMVAQLKEAGITGITGGYKVWGGALPYEEEIDPAQLDHLSYNPAVSGLNLNFNRVHFQWARENGDYTVTMDARDGGYVPEVTVARMTVEDRGSPVYTYSSDGDVDAWTVARPMLGDGGARWLPVRRPSLYAAEVFRLLAEEEEIALPEAEKIAEAPEGELLASHESAALDTIIEDMLLYSTNITAEVLGLTASIERGSVPADLDESAARMSDWLNARYGTDVAFVDHSGLGDASRISPRDLVRVLISVGADGPLRPLMKTVDIRDGDGRPVPGAAEVRAKTGTLNFVSCLAGWVESSAGGYVAFAVFCADLDAREAAKASQEEIPEGSRWYIGRSKQLQQELLNRWAVASV